MKSVSEMIDRSPKLDGSDAYGMLPGLTGARRVEEFDDFGDFSFHVKHPC